MGRRRREGEGRGERGYGIWDMVRMVGRGDRR